MEYHHIVSPTQRIIHFGGDVKEEYNDFLTVGFTMT